MTLISSIPFFGGKHPYDESPTPSRFVLSQVQAALAYISGLNTSVPNVTERVEMYKHLGGVPIKGQQWWRTPRNEAGYFQGGVPLDFHEQRS